MEKQECNCIIDDCHNDTIWVMKNELMGAFAHCVVIQSPYDVPDIREPLEAFNKYLLEKIENVKLPVNFSKEEFDELINEDVFKNIPEIDKLNKSKNQLENNKKYALRHIGDYSPDDDFIDLWALARNIKNMIIRNNKD